MAYVPTRADATPMAADMAARLTSALGVTVPTNDRIVALCDDVLCASGYQGGTTLTPTTSTTSTTYADVAGSSFTFSAPIAKTYVVDVDFQFFRSAGTGNVQFRLVVNGANGEDWVIVPTSTNSNLGPYHLMLAAPLAAGSNVIKLQWLVTSGTTANLSGANPIKYIVRG